MVSLNPGVYERLYWASNMIRILVGKHNMRYSYEAESVCVCVCVSDKRASRPHKSQHYQRPGLGHPCVLLLNVIVAGQPLGRYFLVRNQDQSRKRRRRWRWGVEEKRGGGGCEGNNDWWTLEERGRRGDKSWSGWPLAPALKLRRGVSGDIRLESESRGCEKRCDVDLGSSHGDGWRQSRHRFFDWSDEGGVLLGFSPPPSAVWTV